jgi:hypothetical protein
MGLYTRNTHDKAREKLWDAAAILEIINPDSGYFTCSGYAPSEQRRCRNRIGANNRRIITKTSDEISYLRPGSPAVMRRLRTISGPALCRMHNQNQAEKLVMQWQNTIEELETEALEYEEWERQEADRKRAKATKNPKRQASIPDQYTNQMREMKDLLNGLREELSSLKREKESEKQHQQKERDEKNRVDRERIERERLRKERLEKERLDKEHTQIARIDKERVERERLEKERREQERLKKEELEKERLEKIRLEKERLEQERAEREREEKERRDKEEREKQAEQKRQRDADNEWIRQNALRKKREKEEKLKAERDQAWSNYQQKWVDFRASAPSEGYIRNIMPWPVLSGSYSDVNASTVKEFYEQAVPSDAERVKVMRKECLKWHPDKVYRMTQESMFTVADRMMIDMIGRQVIAQLSVATGKSAS